MSVADEVRNIVGDTLGLGERRAALTENSALLGAIPEFDSMAVVSILTAVEEYYGIEIDDDEVSAEIFETMGSLAEFVAGKTT